MPSRTSLCPHIFSKDLFDKVCALNYLFNELIDRISSDLNYLEEIHSDVVKSDQFTSNLLELATKVYRSECKDTSRDIRLYLIRNDFLPTEAESRILQVEINTISAAFAGIMESLSLVHFTNHSMYYGRLSAHLPINRPCSGFANAISKAVGEHNRKWNTNSNCVLFIVEDGESNIVDQYALEKCLVSQFRFHVIRLTLCFVLESCVVAGDDHHLYVNNKQVALVYFRTGYDPSHYPSDREWKARELIEKSSAVKCPTVLAQLAGTKRVQESWYHDGGKILRDRFGFTESQVSELLSVFARQGLPTSDPNMVAEACASPSNWVLKPQREGGGHNLYGDDLVRVLKQASIQELSQYVLMERMQPNPQPALVIDVEASKNSRYIVPCIIQDSVSELGIYSYYVPSTSENKVVGHLLRTKSSQVTEGGVNAGYAYLDTLALI